MRRVTQWSLLLAAIAYRAHFDRGRLGRRGEDCQRHGRSRFHDRTDHAEQASHETEGRRLVPLRHQ